jgi:predicted CXXCH cytochrome family protein
MSTPYPEHQNREEAGARGLGTGTSRPNASKEGGEIMRKAALIIGMMAGVALVFMAGLGTDTRTASADNGPHVASTGDSTPDKCAACHRIHTGQNEFLHKDGGTIEAFCYSCHGTGGPGSDLAVQEGTFYGGTTPGDPYGGKTASDTVGLRGGGFDQARINTQDPNMALPAPTPVGYQVSIGVLANTQPVKSKHVIDGTTLATMWGNGAIDSGAGVNATLECTSCHDPHGNGNYRILRSIPTGSNAATAFAIPDTYPKTPTAYTTSNYFNMYVGFATPAATPQAGTATPAAGLSILADTSKWCSQCHTRYLAARNYTVPTPVGDDPNSSRVNSGDDIFTFRHTSAGWGRSTTTGNASWNNRACITCHASHGSNASMPGPYSSTVEWPDGGTVNPSYDTERASMLKMDDRGICRRCHNTGSVP